MNIFEILTVLMVVFAFLFFWLRSMSQKRSKVPPPLWFTHLAQRIGVLTEYQVKKAKWGNVLRSEKETFPYNIGGFPMSAPTELFVSVRRKSFGEAAQFEIFPKNNSNPPPANASSSVYTFGDTDLDDFLVFRSEKSAEFVDKTLRPLLADTNVRQLLQALKTYSTQDWVLGTHGETLFYKEPYNANIHGDLRVNILEQALTALVVLTGQRLKNKPS